MALRGLRRQMDGDGRAPCIIAVPRLAGDSKRLFPGKTETETFADVVEQARLYVLTDCGSFEKFSEWGLVRANTDLTD